MTKKPVSSYNRIYSSGSGRTSNHSTYNARELIDANTVHHKKPMFCFDVEPHWRINFYDEFSSTFPGLLFGRLSLQFSWLMVSQISVRYNWSVIKSFLLVTSFRVYSIVMNESTYGFSHLSNSFPVSLMKLLSSVLAPFTCGKKWFRWSLLVCNENTNYCSERFRFDSIFRITLHLKPVLIDVPSQPIKTNVVIYIVNTWQK